MFSRCFPDVFPVFSRCFPGVFPMFSRRGKGYPPIYYPNIYRPIYIGIIYRGVSLPPPGKHRENAGKTSGKHRENIGKTPGKHRENTGKIPGKHRENRGLTGNPNPTTTPLSIVQNCVLAGLFAPPENNRGGVVSEYLYRSCEKTQPHTTPHFRVKIRVDGSAVGAS